MLSPHLALSILPGTAFWFVFAACLARCRGSSKLCGSDDALKALRRPWGQPQSRPALCLAHASVLIYHFRLRLHLKALSVWRGGSEENGSNKDDQKLMTKPNVLECLQNAFEIVIPPLLSAPFLFG